MTYNHAKIVYREAKEKMNLALDQAFDEFVATGNRFHFRIKEKKAHADFRDTIRVIRWKMDIM